METKFRLAILLSSLLCGCAGIPLYGEKSCGVGNAAYIPASASAGICMPQKSAVYIFCARELGMTSMTQERTSSLAAGATIKVTDIVAIDPNVKLALTQKVVEAYAAEGELAKARASALTFCRELAESVPTPAAAAKP